MNKLTLKSVLLNILLIMPILSFAAISEQDKVNFKNIYGGEIKPEISVNILNFCDKNDADIDSCLRQLKAQPSTLKSAQNQTSYHYCCVNVSGYWGDHAYIHGVDYCISPCTA